MLIMSNTNTDILQSFQLVYHDTGSSFLLIFNSIPSIINYQTFMTFKVAFISCLLRLNCHNSCKLYF